MHYRVHFSKLKLKWNHNYVHTPLSSPFHTPPRCQDVFHELLPISLGISLDKYLKYPSIAIYSVPVFDFNGFMHLSYKDQQALLIDVLQRCFWRHAHELSLINISHYLSRIFDSIHGMLRSMVVGVAPVKMELDKPIGIRERAPFQN